jgi:hypothetical protein
MEEQMEHLGWKKLVLVTAAGVAIVLPAAAFALSTFGVDVSTVPFRSTAGVADVKGNCDEPEHANEPRCQLPQAPEDRPVTGSGVTPANPAQPNQANGAATPATPASQGAQNAAVAGDVKGNCDEPEHRNEPRCQLPQAPEDSGTTGATRPARPSSTSTPAPGATSTGSSASTATSGEDVSGPCDEPEHANDPRCNGTGGQRGEDNSSRGSGDSNSTRTPGASSTPSSGSTSTSTPSPSADPTAASTSGSGDDNSGPGSGNSGHGGGGDDDDDSGSGGSNSGRR